MDSIHFTNCLDLGLSLKKPIQKKKSHLIKTGHWDSHEVLKYGMFL